MRPHCYYYHLFVAQISKAHLFSWMDDSNNSTDNGIGNDEQDEFKVESNDLSSTSQG